MDSKEAMATAMSIAEEHTKVALDILRVKPDATIDEALRGTQVWLGAKIMKAICAAVEGASK